MNKNIVSQAIVQLFQSEMFYAEIILSMRRIITTSVPTAGVCIKDTIELHINPNFFESLSPTERVAVLKHECEHILRDHIPRFKELAPEVFSRGTDFPSDIVSSMKFKSMNIAADCAINCHIKDLPVGGVFPKMFDLADNQTTEWYLAHLKDNEKAKNFMQFDGHELWAESDGDKDILKEKIKQIVNKAANKARAAGKMTGEHEIAIAGLNKSLISWKQQLRRFVARSIESKIEESKKRRNRRYGVMYPGTVKIEELFVGIAIDTSGSVSDEALEQFMAELKQISKYAKVLVVEADSEIKNHYFFDAKKKYTVSGRGGTAYKPAFDFFNNEEVDAMIYFGDMDNYDSEVLLKPKYPVLWGIVGDSNPPASFGNQIRIKL